MPIHNWAAVPDGMFHYFHQRWIGTIADWFNQDRLPEGFYAIGELYSEGFYPDVLAVEDRALDNGKKKGKKKGRSASNGRGVAVMESPPKTRFTWESETEGYLVRKNLLAIHDLQGTLVAVVEIVSPGNKSSKVRFRKFIEKTTAFLNQGVHLLVIDLFAPMLRDPHGIHQAIWSEQYDGEFDFRPDKPLTLASYMAASADSAAKSFVEPIAVGEKLPKMPLFLWADRYVNVDLESTYADAWAVYPAPLKPKIEGAR